MPAGREPAVSLPQHVSDKVEPSKRRVTEDRPDRAGVDGHAAVGRTERLPATCVVRVTCPNCGSTSENSPSRPCATHTEPCPTAMPVGVRLSSGIVPETELCAPSILVSVRSSRLPTHTEPSPPAIGPGRMPTGTSATIVFALGSMMPTAFGLTPPRPPAESRPRSMAADATTTSAAAAPTSTAGRRHHGRCKAISAACARSASPRPAETTRGVPSPRPGRADGRSRSLTAAPRDPGGRRADSPPVLEQRLRRLRDEDCPPWPGSPSGPPGGQRAPCSARRERPPGPCGPSSAPYATSSGHSCDSRASWLSTAARSDARPPTRRRTSPVARRPRAPYAVEGRTQQQPMTAQDRAVLAPGASRAGSTPRCR